MKYILLILVLTGCVDKFQPLKVGDCFYRDNTEKWEKPWNYKILEVGKAHYNAVNGSGGIETISFSSATKEDCPDYFK